MKSAASGWHVSSLLLPNRCSTPLPREQAGSISQNQGTGSESKWDDNSITSSLHILGTAPQSSARSFPAQLQQDCRYQVRLLRDLEVRSKWEATCHLMEAVFFRTSC